MKIKLKKILLNTSMIIISSLFAILSVEIILRTVKFEFKLYPSKVQFGWPDPTFIKKWYIADKEKLWVQKDYYKKIDAWKGKKIDIIFMGCSCTEFGKFDAYLALRMEEEYPSAKINFLNFGVGGWTTYQGLKQMNDVIALKPKIITIYYGWNDHWNTFGLEDKKIGKFNLKKPELLVKLSERFRIIQLINKAFLSHKFKAVKDSYRVPLKDFSDNLKNIINIARKHKIIPVLLTAPAAHKKGKEPEYLKKRHLKNLSELIPLHKKYVQAVRKIAKSQKVYLVDLYKHFKEIPSHALAKSFCKDGIHLTEMGSQKITDYLYNFLKNKKLIPKILD